MKVFLPFCEAWEGPMTKSSRIVATTQRSIVLQGFVTVGCCYRNEEMVTPTPSPSVRSESETRAPPEPENSGGHWTGSVKPLNEERPANELRLAYLSQLLEGQGSEGTSLKICLKNRSELPLRWDGISQLLDKTRKGNLHHFVKSCSRGKD